VQPIDLANSTFRYTDYYYDTDSHSMPISTEPYLVEDGSSDYQYDYNNLGKVTKYTDPADRVTYFNYETNSIDLASVQRQNGAGNDTLMAYANYTSHLPQTITDASGAVTDITYNGTVGMLPEVVTEMGTGNTALQTTYYVHNGDGTVDHISQSGGNISNTTLVSFGYPSWGASPYLPNEVDYPDGTYQDFSYDGLMRINEIFYSDYTLETWNYFDTTINGTAQANSLSLNTYTDRLGHTTTYTYDADGHPLTAMDAAYRETQYDWCDCGGLASITDADDHVTSFTYDFAGDVLTKNITVGGNTSTYSYLYDGNDRLSSVTRPADQGGGPTISYSYTADGNPYYISYGGTHAPADVAF
jgi:YD repeat-containing protein